MTGEKRDDMKNKNKDLDVLKQARKALLQSTSYNMLWANIEYLVDYFIRNPSKDLPERLKKIKRDKRSEEDGL